MAPGKAMQLDPTLGAWSRGISRGRRKIVGQNEAVQAVVDLYQVFRAAPFVKTIAAAERGPISPIR